MDSQRNDHGHTADEERSIRESTLDDTLANTFPASDPPSSIPNPDDEAAAGSVAAGGDAKGGTGRSLIAGRTGITATTIDEVWPALSYEAWKDTYATLHMWTQVVGKVALAQAPALNHSWAIALQVTPCGLTTRTLPHRHRSFTIQFDFVEHQLTIRTSDDETRTLPLRPQTVADFYLEVMATLDELGLPVTIWPMPAEIPSPIRFDQDTVHHSYDPAYANRFWRIVAQVARVLTMSQCEFVGKCSPVHFFWGGFDLAVTRFSGRPAPPREGPAFMREAYSHEVISHGFWPGSGPVLEPAFYAYAVPEPPGLRKARVQPEAAYYHHELGEFILPYDAVRTAASPDQAILAFVDTTSDRAASLAGWERAALERPRSSQSARMRSLIR